MRRTAGAGFALALVLAATFPGVVAGDLTLATNGFAPGVVEDGPWPSLVPPQGPRLQGDPGASAWIVDPLGRKVGAELRAGRVPLWNEHDGGGAPLLANMEAGTAFPLRWPLFLFPGPRAQDAYLLFRLWLAGFLAFRFLRRIGAGEVGAVGGGVVYMLGGYLLRYVNMHHLDVDCLLPGLLEATEAVVAGPTRARGAVLAVLVMLTLCGGMPEASFVALATAAVYALWRARTDRRALGVFAAGCGGGLLLAAPVLLPFLEFLSVSWTSHAAVGLLHRPLAHLWTLFFPSALGGSGAPWTAAGADPATPLGLVALCLALNAPGRDRDPRRLSALCALGGVLLLLKAHGLLLNDIGRLPVLRHLIFPKYTTPALAFGLAVLAGLGLDELRRGRVRVRLLEGGILAAALGGGAAVAWAVAVAPREADLGPVASGVVSQLAILALTAIAVAAASRAPRAAAGALVGLLAIDLAAATGGTLLPRRDPFRPAPYVEWLQARVAAEPARVIASGALLHPNVASAFGLSDARFEKAIAIGRYRAFVRRLVQPSATDRVTGMERPEIEAGTRGLALLGVRWLIRRDAFPEREPLDEELVERGWQDPPGGGPGVLSRGRLSIAGRERAWLFQHPSRTLVSRFRTLRPGDRLRFALGVAPAGEGAASDGARFQVGFLTPEGAPRETWSRWVRPHSDPADRGWIPGAFDLSPWRGRRIVLALVAEPGQTEAWDWGSWASVRLVTPAGSRDLTADLSRSVQLHHETIPFEPTLDPVTLGGEVRSAMFQHPDSRLDYVLAVPADAAELRFSVGVAPEAWSRVDALRVAGDGLRFRVEIQNLREETLFQRDLDPGVERGWVEGDVDLSSRAGTRGALAFRTEVRPGTAGRFAWAGWGDLALERPLPLAAERGGVRIYANPDALPRAFLVHRAEVVAGPDAALERLCAPDFPWRTTLVLEEAPALDLPEVPPAVPGQVRLAAYDAQHVRMEVDTPAVGLVFLGDAWYPGWRATLDGRPVPLHVADHAFRAVAVPAGRHVVEMEYAPASFRGGLALAALGIAGLLLARRGVDTPHGV